jgi:hypothetical protein
MSTIYGTERVSEAAAEEKIAAESASPNMVVFAWIWTAVIAYFALQAVLS